MFILLGDVQSFRPGQVLIPAIQLDAHDITANPSQIDAGRCGSIFPLDFEVGREYDPLSEKSVCISACILVLFWLHTLHCVQHTSTLLRHFERLRDKGCSAVPTVCVG